VAFGLDQLHAVVLSELVAEFKPIPATHGAASRVVEATADVARLAVDELNRQDGGELVPRFKAFPRREPARIGYQGLDVPGHRYGAAGHTLLT